jgi:hypothetical protein
MLSCTFAALYSLTIIVRHDGCLGYGHPDVSASSFLALSTMQLKDTEQRLQAFAPFAIVSSHLRRPASPLRRRTPIAVESRTTPTHTLGADACYTRTRPLQPR